MDFDPKTSVLHNQKVVYAYLAKYSVRLLSNMQVELYASNIGFMVSPTDVVYLHPQVLALGLKLSLKNFILDILCHFQVAPSQLSTEAWWTILGFQALCASFAPNSCQCADFCAIYSMRKTNQDGRFFIPRSGYDRLIVNLVDSDHGCCDIVIRVSRTWEAAAAKS